MNYDYDYMITIVTRNANHSIDEKSLNVSLELHCEHSNKKDDGSAQTQIQSSSWLQLKAGIITSHHKPTRINNEFCRLAKYFKMAFAGF